MKNIVHNINRIQQNCFWDYDFTDEEILNMTKDNDEHKVNFLFNKILANSTRPELDLKIFDEKVLVRKLREYKPPRFNNKYFVHRHNALKYIFEIDNVPPKEYEWKK